MPNARIRDISSRTRVGSAGPSTLVGGYTPHARGGEETMGAWEYNQADLFYNHEDYTYDGFIGDVSASTVRIKGFTPRVGIA